MLIKKLNYLIGSLLILGLATPTFAYVMSSTNYRMERDSINFGGGLSTSSSYSSESTIGEVGTGYSTSTSYATQAGYQQMDESWVSISAPSSSSLAPNINIATGGTATTSANILISTNNSTGYTLQIKASTNPALKGTSYDFANYTTGAAIPDYAWSVNSADAEFGFTPEGSDIVTRYLDNGASCNQSGGSDSSEACWDSLTATYATIAQSAAANYPSNTTTTVRFKAEAGSATTIGAGSYSATAIITAYTN